MKKLLTYIVVLLGIFCVFSENVYAIPIETLEKKANNQTSLNLVKNDSALNCDEIFTPDAASLVNEILNYIRIIAPALLVILTAVDFATATLQQDNDAMKKATNKVTKRAIATALLFFVPTIVRAIFNLPGIQGKLVQDPLCGMQGNTLSNLPIKK